MGNGPHLRALVLCASAVLLGVPLTSTDCAPTVCGCPLILAFMTVTFPCDQLVALEASPEDCASPGSFLPSSSPISLDLQPSGRVDEYTCHIDFHFRSGATFSSDVQVTGVALPDACNCAGVTIVPSKLFIPLDGVCPLPGMGDAASEASTHDAEVSD
jgi:hypothetical protein